MTGRLALKKNELQILIPPIVGLLAAFLTCGLLEFALDKYYFPYDPDFGFDFSIYATIYIILFIPLLAVAATFQYFIALKIWNRYIENKKLFKLNMWQLIIIFCVIFGLLISSYQSRRFFRMDVYILIFARRTLFLLVYWFTNYFTMKAIR